MSFGGPPSVPAHASVGNFLRPRRDRAMESERRPMPAVPRAPRAKPRANSCGALAKATWSRQASGQLAIGSNLQRPDTPSRSSEDRRPREQSPFVYARKNLLERERDAIENQAFNFGPRRAICTEIKEDYSRGHILGREVEGNAGVPMDGAGLSIDAYNARVKEPGRRRTLHHERKAADQALEWVPAVSSAAAAERAANYDQDHSRVNVLAREIKEAFALDCPRARPQGCTSGGDGAATNFARRNVLRREQVNEERMPTPRGNQDGYGKRNLLVRETGLPQGAIAAH